MRKLNIRYTLLTKVLGLDKHIFEREIVNIYAHISFIIRFECSKEPSN